jgi:hypothetical protein
MLVALIPGTWRHLYGRPLVLGTTLMPLVAIAMIPLLVGVELIYPWTAAGATSGYAAFKATWLSTGFFVVRTIGYLILLSLIAWALLAAPPRLRAPIAAAGVIVYAIIGSLIGIEPQPSQHTSHATSASRGANTNPIAQPTRPTIPTSRARPRFTASGPGSWARSGSPASSAGARGCKR